MLHDGETLEQIAKEGGLGYPLLGDPADDDDDDAPAVRPAAKPYTFVSLQGSSDADVLAFFRGKERRDWTDGPEDSVETSLPAGFWDMDPRKAALAFADSNRTASHRKKWRLVIDDRGGITPPKSGWVLHDWGSSGCYSYSSHVFAIRFGTARPGMMATDYNSHGVVGANPLADQPGFSARWIDLSEKEARFLADTLFWLDRIRHPSPAARRRSAAQGRLRDCMGHPGDQRELGRRLFSGSLPQPRRAPARHRLARPPGQALADRAGNRPPLAGDPARTAPQATP